LAPPAEPAAKPPAEAWRLEEVKKTTDIFGSTWDYAATSLILFEMVQRLTTYTGDEHVVYWSHQCIREHVVALEKESNGGIRTVELERTEKDWLIWPDWTSTS
jgi:hypothetical protein